MKRVWLLAASLLACCLPAHAQSPRIAALFPAGAKAGETVEVAVKGGGLAGAQKVLVLGAPGVTAELVPSSVGTIDETARPVFQNKCTSCHEPRSPANRSMSPDQWASTVDRMITARGAEIAKPDRDKIVGYLQGMAKAGQVSAKITVAPNAAPGLRELRVITSGGASSAWTFEVGATPEVSTTATAPGTDRQSAPKLALPIVVNGLMAASGQRDYFSFVVKKNERVYFDLKANRLNAQSQANFSPLLVLTDAAGHELAKNLGRFGIDPALAFTPTEDETVTLLVRDLLWKGSPASVYRLSASTAPFADGMVAFPPVATPGQRVSVHLIEVGATSGDGVPTSLSVPASGANGITTVAAQSAQTRLLVRSGVTGGSANGVNGTPLHLPGAFWGKLTQVEQTDVFTVQADKPGGLELYARRLGSPLTAQVVVKNSTGNIVVQRIADNDEDDVSLPNAFPAPGTYRVEISDVNGSASPSCVYAWESVDKAPQFSLSVSPDVVAVAPGGATALVVRAPKRDNLPGPITIRLSGLPPGVTVSPAQAVLPPDADQIVFVLQTAPTAAVASQPIVIEGTVAGGDTAPLTRRAEVTEVFRVNNVLHTTPRKSQMVYVVADAPPFTLALVGNSDRVTLAPGEEVKLKVVVNRSTSKGDVALSILGLPPGVTAQNVITVPAKESTATFTLRASRDAKTLGPNRPLPNLPPVQITVVGYPATGGGNNADFAPTAATPPILLIGK